MTKKAFGFEARWHRLGPLMLKTATPVLWTRPDWFPRWTTAGVGLLLALYLVMAVGASLTKGPSFDEEEELAVGYNLWLHHDFRMESADGDLIKRWATLPYLITRPNPAPTDNNYWRKARSYIFGSEFFFQSGNAPAWLLLQGRVMNALLGAATGLLIFICARELFGVRGGFFALVLFVFSPHMLAFGGMVSTDMSICLTLLGSVWSVWRLLHRVTWGRLGLGVMFVSLLILAKPTALVIFPITFILILIKIFSGQPLSWELGKPRMITNPLGQVGVFGGLFVVHGLCAWGALWAHYDFRYAASPDPADQTLIFTHFVNSDPVDPRVAAFMNWTGTEHLLPEGFLQGIHTLLTMNDSSPAFMNGQWTLGGWSSFFPVVLWEKTSPALIILFAIGMVTWGLGRWRSRETADSQAESPPPFYEGIPYFVLIVVYMAIAMIQRLDIGHRHILPIYPAIYILGGGPIALLWPRAKTWMRVATILLLAWTVGESLVLYPDFLAYFNPLVGGPAKGYLHLVDSSLDWGMELPGVKKWLEENNPKEIKPVYLAYFGTDDPDYYGIVDWRLPSEPEWYSRVRYAYSPGIYIVSATLYESDTPPLFGPWDTEYEIHYQAAYQNVLKIQAANKDPAKLAEMLKEHPLSFWNSEYEWFDRLRFARLCAWLRHNRPVPDAMVGYSMLIWQLSYKDIQAAMLGPPPEIDDTPTM